MFERALGIERLGTIKEISQLAKVAESTVHRVLKGHRLVSGGTRDAVLAAVHVINLRKIELASAAPRRRSAADDGADPRSW
jgi:DNA-binding LacI/PurR family transcriptional regulator